MVIRRHTLGAIFEVMRVIVNYRKRQKQLKKIALHERVLWPDNLSTTERILKNPQRLLHASQCSSCQPIYFCFCNRIKSFWKRWQRSRKPIFSAKIHKKNLLVVKTCIENFFLDSSDMHHFEACWKRWILDTQEFIWKIIFCTKKFGQILWEKNSISWRLNAISVSYYIA